MVFLRQGGQGHVRGGILFKPPPQLSHRRGAGLLVIGEAHRAVAVKTAEDDLQQGGLPGGEVPLLCLLPQQSKEGQQTARLPLHRHHVGKAGRPVSKGGE